MQLTIMKCSLRVEAGARPGPLKQRLRIDLLHNASENQKGATKDQYIKYS